MRRESTLRKAFEAAAAGAAKRIAIDTLLDCTPETAAKKGHRMLGADGDLNPAWVLLDAVARHDPHPILDALCALAGARWEPLPSNPEAVRERLLARLEQLALDFDSVRLDLAATDREPARVRPAERKVGVG